MTATRHTLSAIHALEAHYGSRFRFEPHHLPFWEQALGSLPTDRVRRAVELVIQHHTHGAPGLAEIKRALGGQWEPRKVARTDAHGCPAPQMLGYHVLTCLVEYGTGRVVRAFDESRNEVDPVTQRQIRSAGNVPADLLPPRQDPAEMVGMIGERDDRQSDDGGAAGGDR